MLRANKAISGVCALLFVLAISVSAQDEVLGPVSIKNFGKINDHYYRGSQPMGQDYADLAKLGVRTVINLTSSDAEKDEQMFVEKSGMKYHQIPMTTHEPPTAAKLTEFLKIVNDPVNQPVYVHCVGGKHRTGVMTAVYRMTQNQWTADQAYDEMKHYKFGAAFLHPEFKKFVYDYFTQIQHSPVVPAATAVTTTAASQR